MPKALAEAEVENAHRLYMGGLTLKEAAVRIGRPWTSLVHAFHRRGLKVRTKSESRRGKPHPHARTYPLNEGFFDKITSESQAWLLGFIAADGCVYDNELSVQVAAKDREVLESIRGLLGGPPVFDRPAKCGDFVSGPASCWRARSAQLTAALRKNGVCPRKSLTITPWSAPSAELQRHWWRGVVDGDGWITRLRGGHLQLGLCGNRPMVAGFLQFVKSHIRTESSPRIKHSACWEVSFCGGRLVPAVASLLYGQAKIGLSRKCRLAATLLSTKS